MLDIRAADLLIRSCCNYEDYKAVADFRAELSQGDSLVDVSDPRYHAWKVEGNAPLAGIVSLAEQDGTVVATASMCMKRATVLGCQYTVAETGDTFTATDFRHRGLFTALVRRNGSSVRSCGVELIYGLPNSESLPAYLKMAYGIMRHPRIVSLVLPVNMKRVAEYKYGAGLACRLAQLLGSVYYAKRPVVSPAYRISESDGVPSGIDELWQRVRGDYDVALVRDASYLDWRFNGLGHGRYRFFQVCGDADMLEGYAVLRIVNSGGLREACLVDFLATSGQPFDALVGAIAGMLSPDDVDILTAWSAEGNFYRSVFRHRRFLQRSTITLICLATSLGSALISRSTRAGSLSDSAARRSRTYRWHFTRGDSDGI